MTAKQISQLLIECHRKRGWRADVEFRFHPRRLDVLAISPNGENVIGYEIKVSTQDFRSEMRNEAKRRASQDYCTEFYYVVPFDLVRVDEIPPSCGLLYCGSDYFLMVKRADGGGRTLPPEIEILLSAFGRITENHHSDSVDGLPNWMYGRTPPRPFRFQFDLNAMASGMASPAPVDSGVDFDRIPF